MRKQNETANAVEILHQRYIRGDAQREASLEVERVNAEIARAIRDLRTDAGLTQSELADLIGTTQSAISRLEDADYEGHSVSMLNRIAKALNQRLTVVMTSDGPESSTLRYVFHVAVQKLRQAKGLTAGQLAKKIKIDRDEILAMERHPGYRPSPRTLHLLAAFYRIPTERFAALAGAIQGVPPDIVQSASRFAAFSESFAKLTPEERKALDEFVKALQTRQQGDPKVDRGRSDSQ